MELWKLVLLLMNRFDSMELESKSGSFLKFGKKVQINLWKSARALSPLQAWEGNLKIKDDMYTLLLRLK